MSKKKLLEESTVRSFMKLANIGTLSDKFIQESWTQEEGLEEAEHKEEEKEEEKGEGEGEEEEKVEESTHVMMGRGDADRMQGKGVPADRAVDEAKEEEEEEVVAEVEDMEEGETLEEGDADGLKPLKAKMGTGGKPVEAHQGKTKKTPAAMSKPNQGPTQSKMKGVEGMKKIASKDPNNGQMKPLKVSTKHVGHGTPMKMNESVEEAADMPVASPEEAPTPSDEAGESAEHQETVKGALKKMLSAMQDIAKEYGVDMAVDAGGGDEGGEDMEPPPPPDTDNAGAEVEGEEEAVMEMSSDKMMQETLDVLTKRVAARLLKRK